MTESDVTPTEKHKLIAQTLLKESDRGCAIMGAALLADALEDLLRSFFRQAPEDVRGVIDPLFSGYAPLATFSARIQVAFAIGILPRDLRDKIEVVRKLRNSFAHEWGPIDFDDPRCTDRLAFLMAVKADDAPHAPKETAAVEKPSPAGTDQRGERIVRRLAFALGVSEMIGYLGRLSDRARQGVDIRRVVLARELRKGAESR